MNNPSRNRWLAVAIFFVFMLLHQTDRLLIGSLTSAIMADFGLTEVQMGGIITSSLEDSRKTSSSRRVIEELEKALDNPRNVS